jgi:hypothetical protein
VHRPAIVSLGLPLIAAALLASCRGREASPAPGVEVVQLSQESAGANLRALSTGRGIYVTYPDLGSLSLNLLHFPYPAADGSAAAKGLDLSGGETTYLDRISESPEIDERFGTAPLVDWNGLLNVFYSDREREGTPVLKWVSGPSPDGKWWIDILPFTGEPLAALPTSAGDVELFLASDGALIRRDLHGSESATLLERCDPTGDVCTVLADGIRGVTLFDRSSGRLYALLGEGSKTQVRAIYTDGAVHHSTVSEGRLRVLLYSPRDANLLLLEANPPSEGFATTPVTLCEGTTSVYVGYRSVHPYFLYTEQLERKEGPRYLISLLTPSTDSGGQVRFHRTVLLQSESSIQRFSVITDGPHLYVFFVQDALKAFAVDLENY